MAVSWSNMPHDLNVSIAKRLILLEDFIAFGAVCRSWKSAATKENFTSAHQVPWLMLPEKEGATVRDFYNLKNGKVYQFDMPELLRGKMCYSSLGWLMTLSGKDSKVDLLHPLNHDLHIELPSIETFKNQHSDGELRELARVFGDRIVSKFVLSSSPSLSSDYTVMIHTWERLGFCKAGEPEWSFLNSRNDLYLDVAYYKGQFYVVNSFGSVLLCEIEDPKQTKLSVVVPPIPIQLYGYCVFEKIYLVESAGALLVVLRSVMDGTTEFMVFGVPLTNGDWSNSQLKSLGNRTLFLGYNSSFCVEPSDYYGCKSNCIYFTNHPPTIQRDAKEDQDMGIFHMEDEKTEPHLEKSPNFAGQHLWVEPSF